MLVWLRRTMPEVGVDDGVLPAAQVQRLGDVESLHGELLAQRESLLAHARAEAEAIVQAARQQAAELAESSTAEARRAVAQGYEAGMRRAILEWHARHAEQTVDKATALRRMHEKLAGIVTSAVERIVHTEQRGALYQRALLSVQRMARGANALALRVSAADHEHARSALSALSSIPDLGLAVEVSVDPSLPPGSCVFESEAGIVDASLHTQLEGLRAAMDRAVNKAVASGELDPALQGTADPDHDDTPGRLARPGLDDTGADGGEGEPHDGFDLDASHGYDAGDEMDDDDALDDSMLDDEDDDLLDDDEALYDDDALMDDEEHDDGVPVHDTGSERRG